MFRKWGTALVLILAAAMVMAGAGGGTTSVASSGIDLSDNAGVVDYLTSLGIESDGVVIQRGAHNYAGPSCPGAGYTCTTADVVVQVGPDNQFQCTPEADSFPSPPDGCTIVQDSAGGSNSAKCVEKSRDDVVSQDCRIYQTNTTGTNRGVILQQVEATGGPVQEADQYAGIRQENESGSNSAQVNQDLKQSTKVTDAAGLQSQNGHQITSTLQESETGGNTSLVNQSQQLKEQASGGDSITQEQNTDGDLNTSASIRQFSDSGRNDAHMIQSNDLNANVSKTPVASQTQGSPGGGILGHFEQDSTGLSTIKGSQKEHQTVQASKVDALTQTQYGPLRYGSEQGTNPNDRYDIDQASTQQASSSDAFQQDEEYANCDTSGICTVMQRINQDGTNEQNSCSGPSCHIGVTLTTTSEGTSHTTCEGLPSIFIDGVTIEQEVGLCPTPPTPPPPPPPLIDID